MDLDDLYLYKKSTNWEFLTSAAIGGSFNIVTGGLGMIQLKYSTGSIYEINYEYGGVTVNPIPIGRIAKLATLAKLLTLAPGLSGSRSSYFSTGVILKTPFAPQDEPLRMFTEGRFMLYNAEAVVPARGYSLMLLVFYYHGITFPGFPFTAVCPIFGEEKGLPSLGVSGCVGTVLNVREI